MLALQRAAGNAAVGALLAARLRSPGEQARSDVDAALRELRGDEPAIDTVEKGLRAAKAVGVPFELEGPRPPASALAVTTTGFGPGSVAPKAPVPPPKPVPAVSSLGRAAAVVPKPGGNRGGGPKAPPVAAGGSAPPATAPAALSGDQLLQPPVAPPGDDPAFDRVRRDVKGFAQQKRARPAAAAKAKRPRTPRWRRATTSRSCCPSLPLLSRREGGMAAARSGAGRLGCGHQVASQPSVPARYFLVV